jgi:hypothetical protein
MNNYSLLKKEVCDTKKQLKIVTNHSLHPKIEDVQNSVIK